MRMSDFFYPSEQAWYGTLIPVNEDAQEQIMACKFVCSPALCCFWQYWKAPNFSEAARIRIHCLGSTPLHQNTFSAGTPNVISAVIFWHCNEASLIDFQPASLHTYKFGPNLPSIEPPTCLHMYQHISALTRLHPDIYTPRYLHADTPTHCVPTPTCPHIYMSMPVPYESYNLERTKIFM